MRADERRQKGSRKEEKSREMRRRIEERDEREGCL